MSSQTSAFIITKAVLPLCVCFGYGYILMLVVFKTSACLWDSYLWCKMCFLACKICFPRDKIKWMLLQTLAKPARFAKHISTNSKQCFPSLQKNKILQTRPFRRRGATKSAKSLQNVLQTSSREGADSDCPIKTTLAHTFDEFRQI